jgi:hypothetical protein
MLITPSNAAFCDDKCAATYSKKQIPRERKREAKRQKREFKQRDIVVRRNAAIREFNRYIRLRDAHLPCISCGALPGTFKLTAGHYITAGSCSALRFDEQNVHGQCWWNCNRNKSGNITKYREGIIKRFGELEGSRMLEHLEGPQPTINITVDWYREIEETYKAKCKELEARAA